MPDWLDSWTNTRYLNQQSLAKRWALRGEPEAEVSPVAAPAAVLPYEHSKYILRYGKKAYKRWVASGCPDRPAPLVCPVLAMTAKFFADQRHGVWRSHPAVGQAPRTTE